MSDFKIEGLAKLAKAAEDIKQARDRVREMISNVSQDFANRTISTIKEKYLSGGTGRVGSYSGRLRSSLRYLLMDGDKEMSVTFGSDAPHARAWEFGRKPGSFPPVKALALWAKRVLGVSAKEANGVGFLIARKIAKSGQKARPFLTPGVGDETPRLEANISSLLERAAVGSFGG